MQKPPIHLLEDLASIEEQRRFIVHATKDEYLLPDDLLNDAYQFCEWVERQVASDVTPPQREAVALLRASLNAASTHGVDRTNIADLIEHDAAWGMARKSALTTLTSFGT